jgi:hypothetical protein
MSGPSVMVRVLGDLTGLGKSFGDAQTKGTSAAAGMHSAFSGMLGTLNQTGVLGPFGSALATADMAMQNVSKHGKDVGSTMMGVGGAVAGLGLALSAMGSKDQQAHQQLQAAVKATGKDYDDYAKKIEETIKHEERYGHTAAETQDALRKLTQATQDPGKALQLMGTASDLAAAKHIGLAEAATSLGKAYNGSGRALKEFGITMEKTADSHKSLEKATKAAESADKDLAKAKEHLIEVQVRDADKKKLTASDALTLKNAQDKVTGATMLAVQAHQRVTAAQEQAGKAAGHHEKELGELSKRLSGQASSSAQTFSGHLKAMKAVVEDNVAQFGQKYGPALTAAGSAMAGLGAAVKLATSLEIGHRIAQAASAVATGAVTAATWLWNAALEANPLVLIATLIALVVGAIVAIGIKFGWWADIGHALWAALKAAFHGIWDAIQFVWHWIADHWPLLLSMLFGPFGVAVYLIVSHWQQVVDFFKGLPGKIKDFFVGAWNWLTDIGGQIIDGLLNGVKAAWHKIEDFFTNAGKKIAGFLKNPLGIFSPSRVMAEQGAFIMEGLGIGLMAGFDRHVQSALDRTVAALTPGGGTTSSQAERASAGAGSSTIGRAVGPAVVVQSATFNNGLDLDTFMARAAWAVRTRRM